MVGAVGEMASMKRRKLWKTGEDGLCCSSSAIQTRLGPSSLLEERSEIPIVFVVLLCCRLPHKLGETAKVYRQIDRSSLSLLLTDDHITMRNKQDTINLNRLHLVNMLTWG